MGCVTSDYSICDGMTVRLCGLGIDRFTILHPERRVDVWALVKNVVNGPLGPLGRRSSRIRHYSARPGTHNRLWTTCRTVAEHAELNNAGLCTGRSCEKGGFPGHGPDEHDDRACVGRQSLLDGLDLGNSGSSSRHRGVRGLGASVQ